jgi:hypothetical protein
MAAHWRGARVALGWLPRVLLPSLLCAVSPALAQGQGGGTPALLTDHGQVFGQASPPATPETTPWETPNQAGQATYGRSGLQTGIPLGVAERPRPEYDAQGFRLGGFQINPSLTTGLGVDDNPFAGRTRNTDGFWRITPTMVARSLWSQHFLEFEAAIDGIKYFNNDSLGGVNVRLGALGGLQLNSTDSITLNSSYIRATDAGVLLGGAVPGLLPFGAVNPERVVLN